VVKIPRFAFEKFRNTPPVLGLSMQSVGESMAIGRTFNEALQKGLRSLEIGMYGLQSRRTPADQLPDLLRVPGPERVFAIGDAFRAGMSVEEIYSLSAIDPWFLREMREIVEMERTVAPHPGPLPAGEGARSAGEGLRVLKRTGFSDSHIATLTHST